MAPIQRLAPLIATILLFCHAQAASAQTHVFVPMVDLNCGPVCNGQLLQIDLDAGVIIRDVPFTTAPGFMGQVSVTPDDYVVLPWTDQAQTVSYPLVLSPATGGSAPLTQFSAGSFRGVIADSSRTRLYQSVDYANGTIRVLEPTGTTTWAPLCSNMLGSELTSDASRLFVLCRNEVLVVETTGGTIIRRLAIAEGHTSLGITPDGSKVFVGGGPLVTTYDVATGTAGLQWRPSFVTPTTAIVGFDAATRRLFVHVGQVTSSQAFHAINTDTMTSAGTIPLPAGNGNGTALVIDPGRSRAVMISTASPRSRTLPTISIIDTSLLTLTASARLPEPVARQVGLVLQPAPAGPINLRATRDGRNAAFTWELRPGSPPASDFIIEAGSVSGSENLATVRTGSPWPAFETRSIPPGRYFLRVRTVAHGRVGLPSNEIELVVP